MTSSKLGMYFHLGMYRLKFAIGLVFDGFLQQMKSILVDKASIHPSKPFPGIRGAGNGWMAVDTLGCRSETGISSSNFIIC
jgi:hypothetical protein